MWHEPHDAWVVSGEGAPTHDTTRRRDALLAGLEPQQQQKETPPPKKMGRGDHCAFWAADLHAVLLPWLFDSNDSRCARPSNQGSRGF